MKKLNTILAVVALSALSTLPAHAQIDSSFVTTMQADIIGIVTAIGSALLVAGGVAVAFKWGKGALFG